MSKTTEHKKVLEKTEINREEIKGTKEYIEKYFPIVKASTLSLDDEFLVKYSDTREQMDFQEALISAIKSGLYDFRMQRMDPSFDEEGNICFKSGMPPAVGKSANWWKKAAIEFMPQKESRLGTMNERIAFLGLLIKYLYEKKVYRDDPWKLVCDQSSKLGHYFNSKGKYTLETTGRRQVGEWYDLGNTQKIITVTNKDEDGRFLFAGGSYNDYGDDFPLSNISGVFGDANPDTPLSYSLGLIVISV